jgi:hypothetical protein
MSKKTAVAVIITSVVDVPTAMRMGTPTASTIRGTRKEPPDIPTIPETKPVINTMGMNTNILIKIPARPVMVMVASIIQSSSGSEQENSLQSEGQLTILWAHLIKSNQQGTFSL